MSELPPNDPPWSSLLTVTEVPPQGLDVTLVADAATRDKLATENRIPGVSAVEARLHVVRRGRAGLHVTGRLLAKITQSCVVSLETFAADIDEEIDVEFVAAPSPRREEPKHRPRRGRPEPEPEPEDEPGMDDLDAPDPIVDGKVDLGALAAEFLTLGVDPYPRKPGVAFAEPAEAAPKASAFAKLAGLATRPGGKS